MITHKINTVKLDFSFAANEKDAALPKARRYFYEKIFSKINAGLDTIGGDIYIDKLEVDLGTVSESRLEEIFLQAFLERLTTVAYQKGMKKSLASQVMSGKVEDRPAGIPEFMHFLKYGYWPWTMQQSTAAEILQVTKSLLSNKAAITAILTRLQNAGDAAAERLTILLTADSALWEIVRSELLVMHTVLETILPQLETRRPHISLSKNSFLFLLIKTLLVSPPANSTSKLEKLIEAVIERYYPSAAATLLKPAKEQTAQKAARRGRRIKPMTQSRKKLERYIAWIQTLTGKTGHWDARQTSSLVENIVKIVPADGKETASDKILINNAGLILFHPFLAPVFKELRWLNSRNQFINSKTMQKAILFLQYLFNGKSRQSEHLLVLNKILCGWPLHHPMSLACNFSAKEKETANDMLDSLKEHWTVMKTTSSQGFIESFVKRNGLLQKTDDGYLLQVERKTIDILLESLPFGINLIKLPWNEQIIHIEW